MTKIISSISVCKLSVLSRERADACFDKEGSHYKCLKNIFRTLTIAETIFWNSVTFKCRFDSPQVKRDLTSSTMNFIHGLRSEDFDDWRFWILENLKILAKSQTCEPLPSLPSRNKTLVIAAQNYAEADTNIF